jgi:DNA gyrase/topoisomerase IV subunit B
MIYVLMPTLIREGKVYIAESPLFEITYKDGETEIRIDVNSISELKDYLSKKGIDLEEEIGGEIVSDDDEEGSEESGDEESDPDAEEEVPEYDLDDLGDIFGAEDGQ